MREVRESRALAERTPKPIDVAMDVARDARGEAARKSHAHESPDTESGMPIALPMQCEASLGAEALDAVLDRREALVLA